VELAATETLAEEGQVPKESAGSDSGAGEKWMWRGSGARSRVKHDVNCVHHGGRRVDWPIRRRRGGFIMGLLQMMLSTRRRLLMVHDASRLIERGWCFSEVLDSRLTNFAIDARKSGARMAIPRNPINTFGLKIGLVRGDQRNIGRFETRPSKWGRENFRRVVMLRILVRRLRNGFARGWD